MTSIIHRFDTAVHAEPCELKIPWCANSGMLGAWELKIDCHASRYTVDIYYANVWSPWRPFSLNFLYSDLFSEFIKNDFESA